MCGICGTINNDGAGVALTDVILSMMKVMKHRGPDDENMLMMNNVGFGFVRLSFIDLTGGRQPIQNEDRSVMMVCNGEIFNYRELRSMLVRKGHRFQTETDIEVIVHLYEEYGEDFVHRLNGQFAIAIYDAAAKKVLLVRDHFGIAPLYYTTIRGKIVFASEIKAILECEEVERKLNLKAVDQLIHFPGVVPPETFFKGIYALESGHYLRITSDNGFENVEYWDVEYETDSEDKGEKYYLEELNERLLKAIKCRLIADVPIGFYVSGGLDSSIVACYIDRYMSKVHSSFSAEIMSDYYAEDRYQKLIVEHINSKHHSVQVTESDLWKYMQDVVWYAERALKDTYDVAAYLLSASVRSTPVKAVLTGQGSDELFNGYPGYFTDSLRRARKDDMSVKECEINERLWGDPYFRFENDHAKINEFTKMLYRKDLFDIYDSFSAINSSPIKLSKVENLGTQRRRSYIDCKIRLQDHLLVEHGDCMFFAHSVEGRHPFLDIGVANLAINMPEKYKLKGVHEKFILKQLSKDIVPIDIIRRRKFPFSAPSMSAMLKHRDDLVIRFLSPDIIRKRGVFEPKTVLKLVERYSRDDYDLVAVNDVDYLQIVLSTMILCEKYDLTI